VTRELKKKWIYKKKELGTIKKLFSQQKKIQELKKHKTKPSAF
jgi:hypothetical protein